MQSQTKNKTKQIEWCSTSCTVVLTYNLYAKITLEQYESNCDIPKLLELS